MAERKRRPNTQEREYLVHTLVGFGLNDPEIAQVLEVSTNTVQNDREYLGLVDLFQQNDEERFRSSVSTYAEIFTVGRLVGNESVTGKVLKIVMRGLELVLRMPENYAALNGAIAALSVSPVPDGLEGYYNLMLAVLGQHSIHPRDPVSFFHDYFGNLLKMEADEILGSAGALQNDMLAMYLADEGDVPRPTFTLETVSRMIESVEGALHQLSEREERCVREKFGFHEPSKTYEDIAKDLRISTGVVRLAFQHGMEKLRTSKYRLVFEILTMSSAQLLEHRLGLLLPEDLEEEKA